MAIFITNIHPKTTPIPSEEGDKIAAHLKIEKFKWTDEQNTRSGTSDRAVMFDWIVNKQGKAFVSKDSLKIPVLGVNSLSGQYIRTVQEGKWTDLLLELPKI